MFERNDTTERFYVKAGPAEDRAVAEGFLWLLRYCKEHGHRTAVVIAPAVRNFEYLGRAIGRPSAEALQKKRRLVVDGLVIGAATESKLPYSSEGPVLAVWTRDKTLDKIDAMGAPAICAVAWQPDNIKDWVANWDPVDVRGSAQMAKEPVDNPVVVEALKSLTIVVNVSTGITSPDDRAVAVQTFRLLRDAGEPFDANEVRAWAVRNGWSASDARELSEVAQKILDGRALRGGSQRMLRDDALERWREAAASGTSD